MFVHDGFLWVVKNENLIRVTITKRSSDSRILYTGRVSGFNGAGKAFAAFVTPYQPSVYLHTTLSGAKWAYYVDGSNKGFMLQPGVSIPTVTQFDFSAIGSEKLVAMWAHTRRIWFCQRDTLTAWYMSTGVAPLPKNDNDMTTVLTSFDLAGIFKKSTRLLFGTTWSSDSGEGLDDRCIFVTAEGEVAVYSGYNPSDSGNWTLEGVFEIPKPLGHLAFQSIGGDVIIGTTIGLISVSEIVNRDFTNLELTTLSLPIYNEIQKDIQASGDRDHDWQLSRWDDEGLMVLHDRELVRSESQYVVNTDIMAWSRFRGWQVKYFFYSGLTGAIWADDNGALHRAGVGGVDEESDYADPPTFTPRPYDCKLCWSFQQMLPHNDSCTVHRLDLVHKSNISNINQLADLRVVGEYTPEAIPATYPTGNPQTQFTEITEGSEWNVALWNAGEWNPLIDPAQEGAERVHTESFYTGGAGRTVAPQIDYQSYTVDEPDWTVIEVIASFKPTSNSGRSEQPKAG